MIKRLYNFLKLYDDNNFDYNYDTSENESELYGLFYDAFIITMSFLSCILSIICTVQILV